METLRLIIIRHGETHENASNIVQGHCQGTLSDKGREQAQKVARRLEDEKFDAVFSSDLDRALQTAKILMKDRDGPPVVTDLRLREQDFGVFEGKPRESLLQQMKIEKADFSTFNPQRGESPENFHDRARDFLAELKARHFGQTVVMVTHYGFINVFLGNLLYPTGDKRARNRILNGAVTIVNVDRPGHVTWEAFNCVRHLS